MEECQRTLYDPVRRKNVADTPEERVRQAFVRYLIDRHKYPITRIANEYSLSFNGMARRCDTVIFDNALRPVCIIEYKRPTVKITPRVFQQIARYNSVLQTPYLIITNGINHYCCHFQDDEYTFLNALPTYQQMIDKKE